MRLLTIVSLAACIALAGVSRASAQDEGELPATFTSDRPGFANTTGIAAVGRLTTELGVGATFEQDATGALPQLSMRAGVFDWLELRLRAPDGALRSEPSGIRFGLTDPSLGFKIGGQLHETVSISSVWQFTLPLATDDFGAPETQIFADVQLAWRFWGPLTLTPNAVARVLAVPTPTGTERLFEGGGSLKFSWRILDVLGVFVQSYVLKSEVSDWRVQVGGGLAWMVAPNVQVDASFDIGVTEQGDPPTGAIGTTILW